MHCNRCHKNLVMAVTARYNPKTGAIVPNVQEYVGSMQRAAAAHSTHSRFPLCTLYYCAACGHYTMLAQNPEQDGGRADQAERPVRAAQVAEEL